MADSKSTGTRPRAVGTRDRIVSHLALAGEIRDNHGMASGVLAREIGYPGSSIAFAQLLSGMERSGLIHREVRGKRTYRITLTDGALHSPSARRPPRGRAALGSVSDFDYDELARRLLVQVVRHLAASGADLEHELASTRTDQQLTAARTEQELASARTLHGTLSTENALLREQLRAAERNLELAEQRARRYPVTGQRDAAEVGMLESMLSPTPDPHHGEAAQ